MPRQPRRQSATDLYHVTSRGTGGLNIYLDDADRSAFLAFLTNIATTEDWLIHAYCLMSTHFHLLLRAEFVPLSKGMQRLKGRYGRYFNDRYDRFGHVFEARFPSKPIEDEFHAIASCAYVAVNPVAAGACHSAEQWPWSSHRPHLGLERLPPYLASLESFGVFDGGSRPARDVYRSIVTEKERELLETRAARRGQTPSGSVPVC